MSVDLYDLGQRLRAAATAAPVQRAAYAPALPPVDPIAVTFDQHGLHLATAASTATGSGARPLDAFTAVGVNLDATHRTLVVPDRATLAALAALAHNTPTPADPPEAVIAWWAARAEHPGTRAVLVATEACRDRWVLGVPPEDERHLDTWTRWLAITATGPTALLDLADAVTAGNPLPGLADLADVDARSWEYHRERLTAGKDWRGPDNRQEAALGLATRCDAAELYDSLRLTDPLVASREAFTGTVITTTVTDLPDKGTVILTSDRLTCRMRPGTETQGWVGTIAESPRPGDTTTTKVKGTLTDATITTTGHLVLTLTDTIARPGPLTLGQPVTLRPRAAEANQQQRGRANLRQRYRATGNWLAGGPSPTTRRRAVPLDVVIAAADD